MGLRLGDGLFMRIFMKHLDDTSIYLKELGERVTRASDHLEFFAIVDVPSNDFGFQSDGVQTHEREILFRKVDADLHRGDVLTDESGGVWRVRDVPKPIEDGAFYTAGLIK